MDLTFYKRTPFLVMLAPMVGAFIGWLMFVVSFGLNHHLASKNSSENKTLYALLNLPFWLYSIGAPFAFAAIGFYLTLSYRILGILSQLSGIFLAMLISSQMFWSTLSLADKTLFDTNDHDAVLRLLAAIISLLSLVVLVGYIPIHFRHIPRRNLPSEVEEGEPYEQRSMDGSQVKENNFPPEEYQPLGPLPASHNYAVPYQAHIDDSTYI